MEKLNMQTTNIVDENIKRIGDSGLFRPKSRRQYAQVVAPGFVQNVEAE